ncbi:MAG: sigma factor-like helix-turn-helix DNA-binding protein, partial [Nocardioidaceae bacterium]
HWLGLSVEETADELGIAAGTVKSHTSRALHALQSTLARHDIWARLSRDRRAVTQGDQPRSRNTE